MPLTSLQLLSLEPSMSIAAFIPLLLSSVPPDGQPLLTARPLRWIVDPWIASPSARDRAALDALTACAWDLVVVLPSASALPAEAARLVRRSHVLTVGISAQALDAFRQNNARLLLQSPSEAPPLTALPDVSTPPPEALSSSKNLQLTTGLRRWLASPEAPKTAPSMLNFLAFRPGMSDSYKAYGRAIATDIGKRRGGVAKLVGIVPHDQRGGGADTDQQLVWDEVALAHYPTVWHFADMVLGQDYQAVNTRYRVDALRGTAILCCNELDKDVLDGLGAARAVAKPKI